MPDQVAGQAGQEEAGQRHKSAISVTSLPDERYCATHDQEHSGDVHVKTRDAVIGDKDAHCHCVAKNTGHDRHRFERTLHDLPGSGQGALFLIVPSAC